MAEICFVGDGEPSAGSSSSRPRNSTSRRMDFLQINATAGDGNSSEPSSPPQQKARKRRSVHQHIPGGCEKTEENRVVMERERNIKYGMTYVCGRRREMEDTVSVHTCFATLKNQPHFPLHFFGVFDGHGCSHVTPCF